MTVKNLGAGFEFLGGEVGGQAGEVHVFFGMERGEEERFGCVVEAFASGAVGWERMADVHLNVEEIAEGGGVFIAIEAVDARRAGGDAAGAGLRAGW